MQFCSGGRGSTLGPLRSPAYVSLSFPDSSVFTLTFSPAEFEPPPMRRVGVCLTHLVGLESQPHSRFLINRKVEHLLTSKVEHLLTSPWNIRGLL